jgi:transcription elongation factor S-II
MSVFEINPNVFRPNLVSKFSEILEDEKKATNLEKAIYNYTIKEASTRRLVKKWENPWFMHLYCDRLRTIYFNLKNEEILNLLKNNELLPQTLALMTHQEMNPDHWKELLEKKSKIDESKYDTNLVANTDMFTCGKCKSKKCSYYTMQTRSADEPETIFITCLDCGKHWKR